MSIQEMLFTLKYVREGLAEKIWREGIANRYAFNSNNYIDKPKNMFPDLYEKQKSVPMPDWLKDDFEKKINSSRR